MTGSPELADGGGRKLVREGVGVDINDPWRSFLSWEMMPQPRERGMSVPSIPHFSLGGNDSPFEVRLS